MPSFLKITRHKQRIQDISTTASNEATLERMLHKVMELWNVTEFRLVSHNCGQGEQPENRRFVENNSCNHKSTNELKGQYFNDSLINKYFRRHREYPSWSR